VHFLFETLPASGTCHTGTLHATIIILSSHFDCTSMITCLCGNKLFSAYDLYRPLKTSKTVVIFNSCEVSHVAKKSTKFNSV